MFDKISGIILLTSVVELVTMLFNPTDKSNSLIADIDFLLFGTSAVFNDDYSLIDRTRNVNIAYDEVVAELYSASSEWEFDDTTNTNIPIATIALTANQDHITLLDSASVIHRVRVRTRDGKYKTLEPKTRKQLSDSQLSATGTPDSYFKMGSIIRFSPIPDYGYAAGVEVEFQRGGNYFQTSDEGVEIGFDKLFHQRLSLGAAHRYALANSMTEKANYLSAEIEKMRSKMVAHYQKRSSEVVPSLKLKQKGIKRYGLWR